MFASVDIFANGKQCAMNCSQTMFANNIRWVHALKNTVHRFVHDILWIDICSLLLNKMLNKYGEN